MKERIEWIDTAKGICILLVVLTHVANLFVKNYPLSDVLITFRMPLYFILSGLFFKAYNGFVVFFIRKVNKLVIPYTFFFLLTSVFLPFILYLLGSSSSSVHNGLHNLAYIFSETLTPNAAIWFLVSLFEVNIIFYLIYLIAQKFLHKNIIIIVLSLIIGVIGLVLSISRIQWPYYLDTSFSALPFFAFGWYIKNETNYLYKQKTKPIILVLLSLVFVLIVHYFSNGPCHFRLNSYQNFGGTLQLYPYGIVGALLVFEIARYIGELPFVSFVGRYSIIVLCIHASIIQGMAAIFTSFISNNWVLWGVVFVSTIALCGLLIYPFKRYLGYFTAQKDLIPVPSGK